MKLFKTMDEAIAASKAKADRDAADPRKVAKAERAAEKQRARDEVEEKYGRHVASGAVGRVVEIRDKGFVRIYQYPMSVGNAEWLPLQGISFGRTVQDKSAGGRAAGAVMTGGLNLLTSNQKRDVYLTIVAGGRTVRLKAQGGMAERAAAALEAAGNSILNAQPQPVTVVNHAQPKASVADELMKLAQLRNDGVLTDDEFAAQKAALLAQ